MEILVSLALLGLFLSVIWQVTRFLGFSGFSHTAEAVVKTNQILNKELFRSQVDTHQRNIGSKFVVTCQVDSSDSGSVTYKASLSREGNAISNYHVQTYRVYNP